MNNFQQIIPKKSNEELLDITARPEDWQPEFVELAFKELTENRGIAASTIEEYIRSNTTPQIEEKKTIKGWLSFFLVALSLSAVFALNTNLASFNISDYETGQGSLMQTFGFVGEIILQFGIFAIAVKTVYSLYRFKPNAVPLARIYIILVLATNLLALIDVDFNNINSQFDTIHNPFRGIIWSIIWLFYFSMSKQVKRLYPKQERKLASIDKLIFGISITPVLIWTILIFFMPVKDPAVFYEQYNVIETTSLAHNEFTDGVVAFTKPVDLTIEEHLEDDMVYFSMYDDFNYMTVAGFYDNEATQKYFDEIMHDWRDETFDNLTYDTVDEKNYSKNGNKFFTRTVRYDDPEMTFYWTFTMVFNIETEKVFVINSYSYSDIYSLNDLINSVRFK